MKNQFKDKGAIHQKPSMVSQEIQLELSLQDPEKTETTDAIEKDINAKILKLTMTIMEQYPELSKFLDEMPVTVPNEKDPEITLNILKEYYESLSLMLNKYKTEHPNIKNV